MPQKPKAATFLAICLLLSICLSSCLSGCFRDSGSASAPEFTEADTLFVNTNGVRKPRAPRVTYRTHDSVVTLDILGTASGDENRYWIYRNGKLLEQPLYQRQESGVYHYGLADSLRAEGTYVYTVQFGYRMGELGQKSTAFTYAYPGRSPSGAVSVSADEAQRVSVRLILPARAGAGRARFERRIGAAGEVSPLDTLDIRDPGYVSYRDTAFAPYDTMLYYRASIMEAAGETWLAPTGWDSLYVYNRIWNYLPDAEIASIGAEVRASIQNAVQYGAKTRAFFFLYRGRSATRAEGTKCDSLPMVSYSILLRDSPQDTGSWYYWVEARDPHGRISPRSTPHQIRLNDDTRGPAILNISSYSWAFTLSVQPLENATAYILQRTADTAKAPIDTDTLTGSDAMRTPVFTDAPPSDGYWFYRVIGIAGSQRSEPGDWAQSEYFRRQDSYGVLTVPIRNLGAKGVQVEVPRPYKERAVLFRSSRADGSDSVAVDSLAASDTGAVLRDVPSAGTWYYRAYRYDKPAISSYSLYRTARVRVDFTGKAVGPAILDMDNLGTGIDVSLAFDPDAIAYVLERNPDTTGTWTILDTMSVFAGARLVYSDHPPRNGHWVYRARSLLRDLSLTDPGPFTITSQPWTFRVVYDNMLSTTIANRGSRVECPLTTTASYGYYLKRGASPDYATPVTVDSAHIGDADEKMTDVPSKGIWYYWAERMISAGSNTGSIYRSLPVRVEFTGAPEAISLVSATDGIQVAYPKPEPGDTVEIWRSQGKPDDSAGFSLVKSDGNAFSSAVWIDRLPTGTLAGFFHYRLAMRREGGTTGLGPVKSYYFPGE